MQTQRAVRWSLASVAVLSLAVAAPGAEAPKTFVPPNYPLNTAPVDWPTNPGTRYTMPEMVKRCGPENMAIKVSVDGWTEPLYSRNEMGTYRVGDRPTFSVVIGDANSRYFGSVKDGTDGGTFRCTLFWMDEKGEKVLRTDPDSVRPACATCGGFHVMYFNIPSFAKTGRHRLQITYVHKKLNLDLRKDLWFHAVNDGSWDDSSVLAEATEKYPVVTVLQPGRACGTLGIDSYKGVTDTFIHATHTVPDRNADHANFGRLAMLRAGHYGQEQRALLRFDLTPAPPDAVVAAAWLQLYLADWPGGERGRRSSKSQFVAYEVLKEWQAGRGSGNIYWHNKKDPPVAPGEASWQAHSYPAKWAEPGCGKAGADRGAEPIGTSGEVRKFGHWVTIPLARETVARWVADPPSNRGLLLLGTQACGIFHSSDFEDPAMRPRLILAFSSGIASAGATCTTQSCPLPAE
ncbi:MAG TPA: DNRLRE domain-containing protein [Phycisphaerae bacterium]|nr:DNRLRE domain-containing protein [Phycisphaerae bacterium]